MPLSCTCGPSLGTALSVPQVSATPSGPSAPPPSPRYLLPARVSPRRRQDGFREPTLHSTSLKRRTRWVARPIALFVGWVIDPPFIVVGECGRVNAESSVADPNDVRRTLLKKGGCERSNPHRELCGEAEGGCRAASQQGADWWMR